MEQKKKNYFYSNIILRFLFQNHVLSFLTTPVAGVLPLGFPHKLQASPERSIVPVLCQQQHLWGHHCHELALPSSSDGTHVLGWDFWKLVNARCSASPKDPYSSWEPCAAAWWVLLCLRPCSWWCAVGYVCPAAAPPARLPLVGIDLRLALCLPLKQASLHLWNLSSDYYWTST